MKIVWRKKPIFLPFEVHFLGAKSLAKLPMGPAAPSSSLPELTKSFLLKTDESMLVCDSFG